MQSHAIGGLDGHQQAFRVAGHRAGFGQLQTLTYALNGTFERPLRPDTGPSCAETLHLWSIRAADEEAVLAAQKIINKVAKKSRKPVDPPSDN
jgi:hypothetical protein